ncbi:hypothetical protein [Desulfitobacterium dichloroeliminans]|nr:hypothetical protein [Desulfitobacterium dichloroeliminans]
METGRFQLPTEQERFGQRPDGAVSLSVRTGTRSLQSERGKQNPGESPKK